MNENDTALSELEEMFEDLYEDVLDLIPEDEELDEWIIE